MNNDLKIIKKKYGDGMSKLCRDFFPSILEINGLLSKLLLDNFNPSHDLYNDIVSNHLENHFRVYIKNLVDIKQEKKAVTYKTPKELLDMAGYILYDECKVEKDIQKFKKYYADDERLCTFAGGRLNDCRVFFAVKKNIDEIKREDFLEPDRQDMYGTSIISIQFTRDGTNTLSIKNRYNHTVLNPDSTFSNNLDNIIPGLTSSFEDYYKMITFNNNDFELPGYIKANDGKFYKYNYKINNIYYCPNNIIIDNNEVKKFDKEKYIILDYFILDLQNKTVDLYDKNILDSFKDSIENVKKIQVERTCEGKKISITPKLGDIITIELNRQNQIVYYENNNIKQIEDNFLYYNSTLKRFDAKNLKTIKNGFLYSNKEMNTINIPNLETIDENFLFFNNALKYFYAPNLKSVGENFMYLNKSLLNIYIPKLEVIKNWFLSTNDKVTEFYAPNLKYIGDYFFNNNKKINDFFAPNIEIIGDGFLTYNNGLTEFYAPKLRIIGDYFLYYNKTLDKLYTPNLNNINDTFLFNNLKFSCMKNKNIKTFILKH